MEYVFWKNFSITTLTPKRRVKNTNIFYSELTYKGLNGTLPLRNLLLCKRSVDVLKDICLQWDKVLKLYYCIPISNKSKMIMFFGRQIFFDISRKSTLWSYCNITRITTFLYVKQNRNRRLVFRLAYVVSKVSSHVQYLQFWVWMVVEFL